MWRSWWDKAYWTVQPACKFSNPYGLSEIWRDQPLILSGFAPTVFIESSGPCFPVPKLKCTILAYSFNQLFLLLEGNIRETPSLFSSLSSVKSVKLS